MRLWLVRHAKPLVAPGTCYGRTDIAADAQATADQARRLAALLPRAPLVFSSPLRRCTALAEALASLRPDLQWQADARLQELDFGSWEGRRWSDIAPGEFAGWLEDFGRYRVGDGESVQQMMDRVADAALHTARCMGTAAAGPQREAVWITHAGVIRALTLLAQGINQVRDATQWPLHAVAYGEWTCVDWPHRSTLH